MEHGYPNLLGNRAKLVLRQEGNPQRTAWIGEDRRFRIEQKIRGNRNKPVHFGFLIAYRRNQIRGGAEVQENLFEVPVYDGEEREDSGFGGKSGRTKWQVAAEGSNRIGFECWNGGNFSRDLLLYLI